MSTDFANLVPAAQQGNKEALANICLAFRPLAISLSHTKKYAILGDSVESLAYCTIIELVNSYKGTTYDLFPGYIKKMLIFALNNAAKKQQRIAYHETTGIEDIDVMLPSEPDHAEEQTLEKIMLNQALKSLSLPQRKLLHQYYWENKTEKEIGQQMHISQQAVSKMRRKILKKLKAEMK